MLLSLHISSGAPLFNHLPFSIFLLRFRLVLFGSCILRYVCASLSWNINSTTVCWTILTNLYHCYLPGCLCSCSDIVHIQNSVNRWCTCTSGVVHVHRLFWNCNHKVPSQQVMYVHVVSSTGPQEAIIILNLLSFSARGYHHSKPVVLLCKGLSSF